MSTGLCGKRFQQRFGAILLRRQRLAQAQHQPRVDDILTGRPPMGELRMFRSLHRRAERGHEAGYRNTVLAGGLCQPRGIHLHLKAGAMDERGTQLGDHTLCPLHLGQRPFDQQHGTDLGTVRPKPPHVARVKKLPVKGRGKHAGRHGSDMPRGAHEIGDGGRIFLGLFNAGQVARLADQMECAARDERYGFADQIGRRCAVFAARDAEGGQTQRRGGRKEICA
mmetsp:Transcript_27487/g.50801  ORF Transcript_27487/g.50801 Transcript_27487/m.50801 type:complete len:224 (+) Transcript_27487:1560-2231(+)